MQAAYEAVVHAAVVGPVFVLASLIEAASKVCGAAAAVVDRIAP